MQELLKEMEGLAEIGEWAELEAALQRVQGAPNDAATNLRYAAICAGPQDSCRFSCSACWSLPGLAPCCEARFSHASNSAAWVFGPQPCL